MSDGGSLWTITDAIAAAARSNLSSSADGLWPNPKVACTITPDAPGTAK